MAKKKAATEQVSPPASGDLSYIAEGLRHLAVGVYDVNPDETNSRVHDERSVQGIMDSLRQYGQDQPIVVTRQGMVVRKGNGRLMAARRLMWTHIAAVIIDEEELVAVARGLADNKTHDLSWFDDELLARAIKQLGPEPQVAGFSKDDIGKYLTLASLDAVAVRSGQDAGTGEGEGEKGDSAATTPLATPESEWRIFQAVLSTDQEQVVRRAITAAKKKAGSDNSAAALYLMAEEWLNAQGA